MIPQQVDFKNFTEQISEEKVFYKLRSVEPHATGLALPSHMVILDDDTVLVSEFARGVVRDVTEGGDYADTEKDVFVSGMKHPGGLYQMKNKRIIAADSGTGRIYDITAGGKVSDDTKIFEGISHPYGVIEFRNNLYTSFSNNEMSGIALIEEGGIFTFDNHAYVYDFPVVKTLEPYRILAGCGGSWATAVLDNKMMFSHAALGAIYDVTNGGTFSEYRNKMYAWGLNLPLGMTVDPINKQLFVCERGNGDIKLIDINGGYSRFAQPLITGFKDCSCIRFIRSGNVAYVCDRAVGTVYKLTFDLHKLS